MQADPRSPERGQYSFLQDIVKKVAYEMLSKAERKAKHLAAARFLVHLVGHGGGRDRRGDRLPLPRCVPGCAGRRRRGRDPRRGSRPARAGRRAGGVARRDGRGAAGVRAGRRPDGRPSRAGRAPRAGRRARLGRQPAGRRVGHYEQSIALFEAEGATHPAARVGARLAEVMWDRGRLGDGLAQMDAAFDVLAEDEPDEDLAVLAAQLGRFTFFAGDSERAAERIEAALELAEALSLPEVLAQALDHEGDPAHLARPQARRVRPRALRASSWRASTTSRRRRSAPAFNLADCLAQADRYEEAAAGRCATASSWPARSGNRYWEQAYLGQVYPFFAIGAWDELFEMIDQLPQEQWLDVRQAFSSVAHQRCRGGSAPGPARPGPRDRADARGADRLGRHPGALRDRVRQGVAVPRSTSGPTRRCGSPSRSMEVFRTMGVSQEYVKEAYFIAGEAAFALGDIAKVDELVALIERLPPGQLVPVRTGPFAAAPRAPRGASWRRRRGRAPVQACGRPVPRARRARSTAASPRSSRASGWWGSSAPTTPGRSSRRRSSCSSSFRRRRGRSAPRGPSASPRPPRTR